MIPGLLNYWVVAALLVIGLYVMMTHNNLIKKIIGLNIFQASVILFYVSMGKVEGGTAPILAQGYGVFSNPLAHVLMLTAIVVGVAVTAVGLALAVRIHEAYGTIEDDQISLQERP